MGERWDGHGRWDVDGPTTIEVGSPQDPVREVRVRVVGGRADVVAAPQDADTAGRATVAVTAVRGRGVVVTFADGVLELRHPELLWSGLLESVRESVRGAFRLEDAVEVSIAVPHEVAVELGTVTADGLVSGTRLPAKVRTVSGTIAVDDVRADLQARTVSGSVEVTGHDGAVSADSVSGSLTVQALRLPRLVCGTVSGSLTVDLVAVPCHLRAKTVSGDVTVRIPADAGFTLEARSVSGAVVADGERLPARPGSVQGRLGHGHDVTVGTRTVSGDVTLLRAEPVPSASLQKATGEPA